MNKFSNNTDQASKTDKQQQQNCTNKTDKQQQSYTSKKTNKTTDKKDKSSFSDNTQNNKFE